MMHEKARARYIERIKAAAGPQRDFWLDQYADVLLRATEWDADQWGFDPDRWMDAERAQLRTRGGRDHPREAV
jgi:hypothetical protein